ncbi:MAG: archaemetzincin family Zn-dependent metalloprotease [Candidatus Scalinduaceae bacterium]
MKENICIIPIGYIDEDILHYTQKELEERLNVEIDIGKQLKDPDYAYNRKREQYHSTLILKRIRNLRLLEYDRVLGIVDVDLYVPELTFVFGEAVIAKKVAVISLVRLRQEFYGLPDNLNLFKKRIITEAVHELGHTYGLRHCSKNNCVMFFSNTLSDTDLKGSVFCKICKKAVKRK